ncbi:MAG: long-chain fatty acid--CoA ligase [Pyrinomonadaceae bacterium]|nr:long-chain fatty acid--CoA ligase [Pyrinomonadaceae bacterium]
MQYAATTLNLSSIIEHHARLIPDKEAVIWNDTRLTYSQLNNYANKIANGLTAMGIGYGDKVALICPNLPYFPMVYYGILKAGAAVVPLNVLFSPREIAYHLADSDAKAVFVFEGTPELPIAQTVKKGFDEVESCEHLIVMTANPAAPSPLEGHKTLGQILFTQSDSFQMYPTKPDDTCAILYTSGTTGQPKGAELTHSNIYYNAIVAFNLHVPGLNYSDGRQKVCLITLPLFHTTGQTAQMNAQMFAGHKIVLLPRFEAKAALDAIKKEGINFWTGVPTMYWAILKYVEENNLDPTPYAETMAVVSSGGAPMPVELMKKFEETFDVKILEGYGLSETSPISSFSHLNAQIKPGTVGQAIFGVEVRCVDENDIEVPRGERGEVVMRGHNIMKGYYKRPEATAEAFKNGWFHSGDIGIMDAEGYLQIVDRKKDMILRGGYNVYPRELEEVLMTHEAVSLVAVIGVPCNKMGEEVKAFIVKKQGFENVTEADIIEWSKEQFAAYKYPRFVEFREGLPIGGTGKILKRALREELEK